jgi:hypothetical protein
VSDDAPTLGEVVRRLDEVSRRLDDVSARLEQRASQMEAAFVRKDVFEAVQQSDAIQMRGLEGETHSLGKRLDTVEDRRRQDRALLLGSLAFPLLVALIVAVFLSGGLS